MQWNKKNLKENNKNFQEIFNKKRPITVVDEIETKCNIQLDHRQRSRIKLPASNKSLPSFLWLDNIFKCIGDIILKINETHMDSGTDRKLYGENTSKLSLNET